LIPQAPLHEGTAGVARWLQELIYGDVLSDAAVEQSEGFEILDTELAGYAEQVWAACLKETQKDGVAGVGTQRRRCNAACLRQRLLELKPKLKKQFGAPGWNRLFSHRLIEQGVVTFTVKKLRGCLSPVKSLQWSLKPKRGVEVPVSRLPAALEL
jgi:hypothetical protein